MKYVRRYVLPFLLSGCVSLFFASPGMSDVLHLPGSGELTLVGDTIPVGGITITLFTTPPHFPSEATFWSTDVFGSVSASANGMPTFATNSFQGSNSNFPSPGICSFSLPCTFQASLFIPDNIGDILLTFTTGSLTTYQSSSCPRGCDIFGSGPSILFIPDGVAAVPEPATWAMLLIGFASIGFAASRRKRFVIR